MELQNQGSGAPSDQVGDKDQDDSANSDEKLVKFDDHKRALDDLHKFKSGFKDLRAKVNDYEAKMQAVENDRLLAEGKKDELLDNYKARIAELEEQDKKRTEAFYTSRKHDAVLAAAMKAGLRKEAVDDLELLTLDGVDVEVTDQGRVLVHGADDFAEGLKQKKSHWFKSDSAPVVNSGGASGQSRPQELSESYMLELERKAKSDPKVMEKYKKLWPEYLAQLKKRRMGAV